MAVLAVYVVSVHLNIRPIFTFLTALVSARATYELIHAVGGRSRVLFTVSSLFSAAYVAVVSYDIAVPKPAVILSFYRRAEPHDQVYRRGDGVFRLGVRDLRAVLLYPSE